MNCGRIAYNKLKWQRIDDAILARGACGAFDSGVIGDPCIVWDEEVNRWRMFYFILGEVDGQGGARTAHALSSSSEQTGIGEWEKQGLVDIKNPEAVSRPTCWHKWWVVTDAHSPSCPVRIDGLYRALFVSQDRHYKVIQSASSQKLTGPWQVDPEPVIVNGQNDEFDGLNADTPTAYWFREKKEVLIFYKGYPETAQAEQEYSPYGSSQAIAWWNPQKRQALKAGQILKPVNKKGHWAGGWIGGLQLLPFGDKWIALINASPTPPEKVSNREPAPSMGGWAICDNRLPVDGWRILDEGSPLEMPEDLPDSAIRAGQGVNFWRHNLLIKPDGELCIYYNSGSYGHEQLYMRKANFKNMRNDYE